MEPTAMETLDKHCHQESQVVDPDASCWGTYIK